MAQDGETIAVVGLGYVGLPVALAFARRFPGTLGFDINTQRIAALKDGIDHTGETSSAELAGSALRLTSDPKDLTAASVFVVAVPTPITADKRPDLTPLERACAIVAPALKRGAVVVFESTVYPGVTEEVCGPLLAALSGLRVGEDFTLGYSPERINPGDREHTLEHIVKVVSGQDAETLDRVAGLYAAIVPAGVHRAESIKVAEAAKVIENTQRDLNIALMNELALIFDRMGIRTHDVLRAARTKWNFLPFTPGLVGGHCIGVDPYYLTTKAEALGYTPQVILAGRRINDGMGAHVALKIVKFLAAGTRPLRAARVGVLGLTFKENVSDLRNSRVPDILAELRGFGIDALVHDALADAGHALDEYGVALTSLADFTDLDALILAVPHRAYLDLGAEQLASMVVSGGVFADLKSAFTPQQFSPDTTYWSL
jgi:UDP-N-acetyl-D-glucosamine/UDP-N-acetyl-D-galactosamine dehydrogenase